MASSKTVPILEASRPASDDSSAHLSLRFTPDQQLTRVASPDLDCGCKWRASTLRPLALTRSAVAEPEREHVMLILQWKCQPRMPMI